MSPPSPPITSSLPIKTPPPHDFMFHSINSKQISKVGNIFFLGLITQQKQKDKGLIFSLFFVCMTPLCPCRLLLLAFLEYDVYPFPLFFAICYQVLCGLPLSLSHKLSEYCFVCHEVLLHVCSLCTNAGPLDSNGSFFLLNIKWGSCWKH